MIAKTRGSLKQNESPARRLASHARRPAKRFDTFMNERCKGKDASKLRLVIE